MVINQARALVESEENLSRLRASQDEVQVLERRLEAMKEENTRLKGFDREASKLVSHFTWVLSTGILAW